jgi:hypothetical protein
MGKTTHWITKTVKHPILSSIIHQRHVAVQNIQPLLVGATEKGLPGLARDDQRFGSGLPSG